MIIINGKDTTEPADTGERKQMAHTITIQIPHTYFAYLHPKLTYLEVRLLNPHLTVRWWDFIVQQT